MFYVSIIIALFFSYTKDEDDRKDYNGLKVLFFVILTTLSIQAVQSFRWIGISFASLTVIVFWAVGLTAIKRAYPHVRLYIALGIMALCLGIFGTYGMVVFKISPQSWPRILPYATILILIPLTNLPFDYFSIGLTRYALKKSFNAKSQWKRTKWALIDLCVAIIMMIALCIVMIFILEAFNATVRHAGSDLIPAPVADQIREISSSQGFQGQHFWLYFALFSTLLPTAIHMTIWAVSLSTIVLGRSDRLSRMINPAIMAQSDTKRHIAAAILAFQWIVAIALVAAVILALYHGARNASFIAGPFLWLMENTQQASANLFK